MIWKSSRSTGIDWEESNEGQLLYFVFEWKWVRRATGFKTHKNWKIETVTTIYKREWWRRREVVTNGCKVYLYTIVCHDQNRPTSKLQNVGWWHLLYETTAMILALQDTRPFPKRNIIDWMLVVSKLGLLASGGGSKTLSPLSAEPRWLFPEMTWDEACAWKRI